MQRFLRKKVLLIWAEIVGLNFHGIKDHEGIWETGGQSVEKKS